MASKPAITNGNTGMPLPALTITSAIKDLKKSLPTRIKRLKALSLLHFSRFFKNTAH